MATSTERMLGASGYVQVAQRTVKFLSFRIEQPFGAHHTFRLTLFQEELMKSFMSDPLDVFDLVGSSVFIEVEEADGRRNNPEARLLQFKGITTKAWLEAGDGGGRGKVVLTGASPTILLDQSQRMEFYTNNTLAYHFRKLYEGVDGMHLAFSDAPQYKSKVDFLMQYKETDWQFMQRVARQFGENLFYNGRTLMFGEFDDSREAETLTYNSEISSFEFSTHLHASDLPYILYQPEQDRLLSRKAAGISVVSNPYTDNALKKSENLTWQLSPDQPMEVSPSSVGDMNELVARYKDRAAADMVYITGVTNSLKAAIGRLVHIQQHKDLSTNSDLGLYRIVSCVREFTEHDEYTCHFAAIPGRMPVVPVPAIPAPMAYPLIGTVRDNADPAGHGRVMVSFPFAKNNGFNRYWMRVKTPYAGTSDAVKQGRGFTFIPEIGDQVVVDFEMGNPNKPFVSGSLFNGTNATGGGAENHKKSIITASGHTIEFDDSEASMGITIKDANGNCIHLDSKGKNIEITAPETMTFNAKNMVMNVDENMEMNIGKDSTASVGGKHTCTVEGDAQISSAKHTQTVAGDATLTVDGNLKITAADAKVDTTDGDFVVKSAGVALIQGAEDAKISKG